MLLQIILATAVGGVLSLIGGILLLWRERAARRISLFLVSFAIGSLTGAAFLELIPEAMAQAEYAAVAPWILVGIFAIFLFERAFHWFHLHEDDEDHIHDERIHLQGRDAMTAAVLLGDAIHNFVDGVAIAASFSVSPAVGAATTVAVFLHEIPQEIGDFGILLHLGYKRSQVLWYNFLTALTALLGAILAYVLLPIIGPWTPHILAFTAGSFIYIAVSDLLPELHHHKVSRTYWLHITLIALGVLSVGFLGLLLPE